MGAPKKTLYEILELPHDANELDIGLAFQRRMHELQRDTPQDPSRIAYVTQAHEVLSDPRRRAAYDASLLTAREKEAAAAQAGAPDLVLEGDDDAELEKRTKRLVPIGIGVAVVALVIIGIRMFHHEAPKPPADVVEAPKPPPPPPPPKPLTSQQIFSNAAMAVGQVMSYEMSGRAVPLGLALSVEPGTFVTTCHGIPAGSQLMVRSGGESRSATLTVTDEKLDLCRLAVAGFDAKPLVIAADEVKAGNKVYALGANAKGELALTEGTVKQVRTSPAGQVIELSFPISKTGNGGAVFDSFGQVVGIATTDVALPAASIAQMRTRGK